MSRPVLAVGLPKPDGSVDPLFISTDRRLLRVAMDMLAFRVVQLERPDPELDLEPERSA